MSGENVKLYRQGIDAFNRRDLDAFLALAHPDVVGISRVLAVEDAPLGATTAPASGGATFGVFPDFKIEVVSVRDAGQLVVSGVRNRAHDAGAAVPLEEFVWQVSEWRDGQVVRWQMY